MSTSHELLEKLKKNILANKSILFLGQDYLKFVNTSLQSFVPSICEILRKNKREFEGCKDFNSFCRALLESGVSKEYLLRAIQKTTESVPITEDLELVINTPWRAIFTTAIDDLFIRGLGEHDRLIRFVYNMDFQTVNARDPNNLYVFRLFGGVDQIEDGRIPTFETAIAGSSSRRPVVRRLLDQLSEIAGFNDANVVIAGLTDRGGEKFVAQQLFERLQELGSEIPSIWFEKEIPAELVEAANESCQCVALELVPLELPQFLQTFKSEIKTDLQVDERAVRVGEKYITIDEQLWRRLQANGIHVLSKTSIESLPYLKKDRYDCFRAFLGGAREFDWRAHASGFVFERKIINDFFERMKFKKEFPTGRSKNNRAFTISGPAGSGKSVILKQIAWMAAQKEGWPVVFIPKSNPRPDFQLLDLFCNEIQTKGRDADEHYGAEKNPRVLIIWDDYTFKPDQYVTLANYLKSTGRSAYVVGSIYRPSRIESVFNFLIPTALKKEETDEFRRYLNNIDSDIERLLKLNVEEFVKKTKDDFLQALWVYLPPTRSQMQRAIHKQYDGYEETIKPKFEISFGKQTAEWSDLAALTFIPSQFDCWPNLELVLDAMGKDHRERWRNAEKSKLLIEDFLYLDSCQGVQRLRCRSAWVAQKSMTRYTLVQQVSFINKLAKSVKPKSSIEAEFLERLFVRIRNSIDYYSAGDRNGVSMKGQELQLANILKELREEKDFRRPILMHTEGLLRDEFVKRRILDLPSAESGIDGTYVSNRYHPDNIYNECEEQIQLSLSVLKEAVELLESDESYRGLSNESQNIATSIAAAYRDLVRLRYSIMPHRQGEENELRLKIEQEDKLVRAYCDKASTGSNPNPYEIDIFLGHLTNRYNDSKLTDVLKTKIAAQMLDELDRWVTDFSDDLFDKEMFLNRRLKVEELIGLTKERNKTVEELRKLGNLKGYYLSARAMAYEFDAKSNSYRAVSDEKLKRARSVLESLEPSELSNDKLCLDLYFRILWDIEVPHARSGKQFMKERDITATLSPDKWREFISILEQLISLETAKTSRILYYKFMLSWGLFQIGEVKKALRQLSEMREFRFRSALRVASFVRISDENGDYRRFVGEVQDIDPRRPKGSVYSPYLGVTLPFNKDEFRGQANIGDRLTFEVVLNYSGASAHKPKD